LIKEVVTGVQQPSSAMEKYRVSLADEERAVLQSLVRKGKAAARKIAHARILLLADQGQEPKGHKPVTVHVEQIVPGSTQLIDVVPPFTVA
jgi:hypothetical protein